jgi:hypothetical protein
MSSKFIGENLSSDTTKQLITERGNDLVQAMWAHRKGNLIEVYRTCSEEEAWGTFTTMCAGGQVRLDLKDIKPPEEQVVQQVGNNETWFQKSGGVDPRLLLLQSMGLTNQAPVRPREVVEYSKMPTQLNLDGHQLKVWINLKYTSPGSGLQFEGFGVVVQIGTPLAIVQMNPPFGWPVTKISELK